MSTFHHISKIMISIISRNLCVYCCWFPRLLQLVIHLFSTIAIIDVSIVLNWFNVLRHYISGWIDTWSKFEQINQYTGSFHSVLSQFNKPIICFEICQGYLINTKTTSIMVLLLLLKSRSSGLEIDLVD